MIELWSAATVGAPAPPTPMPYSQPVISIPSAVTCRPPPLEYTSIPSVFTAPGPVRQKSCRATV